MKASELIDVLNLTIEQCGDLEVVLSHYEKTMDTYVHIDVNDTALIDDDISKNRILIF